MNKEVSLDLIKKLTNAFGPSGFEDDAIWEAKRFIDDYKIGSYEEDRLRNLYIYREKNTGNRPVLMLDAHIDEVGFMVHSIKDNGLIRFVTLGGWNKLGLAGSEVLVRNRNGEYIHGVIGAKPVHFMNSSDKNQGMEISDFSIDIGATSKADAIENFGIRIGEPICPATRFRYDNVRDVMIAKAFDCRIGCAALIRVMDELKDIDLPFDLVGVLSSQEEVGERGEMTAVAKIHPDTAICFEGCPSDDAFTESYAIQTALKKGPMFRFMDVSTICNPRFMRFVEDVAIKNDMPCQFSVREGGGVNASVINTYAAIPSVVAGVPVRYIHSMACIASYYDFEKTVELVKKVILELTPEITNKF